MPDENGWNEWSKHVLYQLQAHDKKLDQINNRLSKIEGEIKLLKYKSTLWGSVGCGIVWVILWLVQHGGGLR